VFHCEHVNEKWINIARIDFLTLTELKMSQKLIFQLFSTTNITTVYNIIHRAFLPFTNIYIYIYIVTYALSDIISCRKKQVVRG